MGSSDNDLWHAEMGDYPLPTNRQEIAAAIASCDFLFGKFPYLDRRYGERGRLFCRSGGGFLIVTCRYPDAGFLDQVRWLVRVRSSRGMPGWLLERHLSVLHACLERELPQAGQRYDGLLTAEADLARLRRRHMADESFLDAAGRLAGRVPASQREALPEAGTLLASALCDEAAGSAGSVDALLGWLADPARFPGEWSRAVRETADELAAEVIR